MTHPKRMLCAVGALALASLAGGTLFELRDGHTARADAPAFGGAAGAGSGAPGAGTVDFQRDVHPIFADRCYRCHAGASERGGFQLDREEGLRTGGDSGPVIVPGDSAASLLVQLVAGEVDGMRMPPTGPPLDVAEVELIRRWVDEGALWNLGEEQEGRWEPPLHLSRPPLPDLVHPQWDHPIDRFAAAYLERQGLALPAPVDDAQFIRRVYLDVIGLLPSAEKLEAFRADNAPDKRERLVRELLADNRGYAEHWMTFWNDALRNDYQGTGYIDGGRKQITPWLYGALYQNLPYDQFAYQLISPTAASEGFIRGIVWRGAQAAPERPPMQAAVSVSQVFLGVNLKCAACHDSFVSDWKLADAYGMANVFSDEPLELVRCDSPLGEMADTRFLWPELGEIDADRPREGRLAQLARLLTDESNGRFARTIVNRLWAVFFGRGFVHPVDEMDFEPWHAGLMDWLAMDLVDHGYNLKHTMERILTSRAYQMPAVLRDAPAGDAYVFAGPEVRRLTAEQFMDALSAITGQWQDAARFTPPGEAPDTPVRAWRVTSDPLTRMLGRPNREQVITYRQTEFSTLQAVELASGGTLAAFLERAARTLRDRWDDDAEALVRHLYVTGVQREPAPAELALALEALGEAIRPEGLEDFLWALAMTPEFQLIL